LENVLTEVFQLFPGKYIHIGGDEVPHEPWEKDQACQALMKREGLKTSGELQSWFIRRIEEFINAHGKTLIGWSEIANGGLAKSAVLMDWIGGGEKAAREGHDVVMTPTSNCYFDFYQSNDHSTEPLAMGWGGSLPLETVYAFEPVPAGLASEAQSHILGAQGNMWTELVPNLKHAEYMIFPRLCALAEVTWSAKDARNFNDFAWRLKIDERRLNVMGVNYRPYSPDTRTQIGGWTPIQIKTEPALLEWDVTKDVAAAGQARVSLNYTEGACGIDIAWVALLEDGKEISRDTHDGFTGAHPRQPAYILDVPASKPGAHYTLRAQIAGDGGTDSTGSVFWDLKPKPAQ
jgi:hexosaminidase